MTEKADHLIERAAALLRSANAARLPEHADAVEPAPVPNLPRAGANGTTDAVPSPLLTGVPPLLVPPSRPLPIGHSPAPAVADRQKGWTSPDTLPANLGITSAAEIPPSPSRPAISLEALERAGLMVARAKRTRITEEYRIVIGRVLRALHDEPEVEPGWEPVASNVVMVTSARPGEGKTFSALNIAASIAQNAAESVLLVDVDPKIRPISDQLGLDETLGFMDFIAEPSLLPDDLVLPTELPNLSFLPLGTRVTRRGEAAADDASVAVQPITPAIHRLARRYPKSLIMLDAPPCLSTSDPHTIAPHVGQVIMVVEAERTQRSEVEAALDLVRVCPTITMLLNKVRMTSTTTFGTYDYFGSYT